MSKCSWSRLSMNVVIAIMMVMITVDAHVTLFPNTAVLGTTTYIYAQVPHSCGHGTEKPNTIGISVRVAANVTHQPMMLPGWNLSRTTRTLGNGVVQNDWVTWSGGAFPTWQLGLFGFSMRFPAGLFSVGQKVYFQTIQLCDGNTTDEQSSNWTLIANAQPTDDLDYNLAITPGAETSPSVTIIAAPTTTATTTSSSTAASSAASSSTGSSSALTQTPSDSSSSSSSSNDSWGTADTLSIIAIILSVISLGVVFWWYRFGVTAKSAASSPQPTVASSSTPQPQTFSRV